MIKQSELLAETSKKDGSNLDRSKYKLVRAGDIAYNKMRAWQGAVGVSDFQGIVSPAYVVVRPRPGYDPRYFHHLLRTPGFAKEAERWSYGITSDQWSLRPEHFKMIHCPAPSPQEQVAVSCFLDHADRRIRRYIGAKQRLIRLLEEQKQAIIHRAVTRGLNPNVRLKPSGVQWLGDVPEHWEVRRLKTLVSAVEQGISPQAENFLADAESWGVLKSGCCNRGIFRDSEHKRLPDGFAFDPSLRVSVGDVLVSRASGSPRLVGSVARVISCRYKLILSDKTFRPVFNGSVDPDFMVIAMNNPYYRWQVEQAISGAEGLANNLPLVSLKEFLFALPPFSELQEIVSRVHAMTTELERALSLAATDLDLIREYRTRLIADVVTGKLDVRAVALPDDMEAADEAAELDEAEMSLTGGLGPRRAAGFVEPAEPLMAPAQLPCSATGNQYDRGIRPVDVHQLAAFLAATQPEAAKAAALGEDGPTRRNSWRACKARSAASASSTSCATASSTDRNRSTCSTARPRPATPRRRG